MRFTIDRDKGKGVEPSAAQQVRSPIGPNWLWSTAITYVLLLAVFVMAGFITLERMLNYAKRPGPEASAMATIEDGIYAVSLGSLSASKLIASVLASGTKDGYTFTVSTGTGNATYTIDARPITYGETGTRSFFADETGVIRYTTEDRPATSEDPPL